VALLKETLKTRFVRRNRYFEKRQGIFKNVHWAKSKCSTKI